jgi:hypothetical protein
MPIRIWWRALWPYWVRIQDSVAGRLERLVGKVFKVRFRVAQMGRLCTLPICQHLLVLAVHWLYVFIQWQVLCSTSREIGIYVGCPTDPTAASLPKGTHVRCRLSLIGDSILRLKNVFFSLLHHGRLSVWMPPPVSTQPIRMQWLTRMWRTATTRLGARCPLLDYLPQIQILLLGLTHLVQKSHEKHLSFISPPVVSSRSLWSLHRNLCKAGAAPIKAWTKLSGLSLTGSATMSWGMPSGGVWPLPCSLPVNEMAKYGDETSGEFALDIFKIVYIYATRISYVSS